MSEESAQAHTDLWTLGDGKSRAARTAEILLTLGRFGFGDAGRAELVGALAARWPPDDGADPDAGSDEAGRRAAARALRGAGAVLCQDRPVAGPARRRAAPGLPRAVVAAAGQHPAPALCGDRPRPGRRAGRGLAPLLCRDRRRAAGQRLHRPGAPGRAAKRRVGGGQGPAARRPGDVRARFRHPARPGALHAAAHPAAHDPRAAGVDHRRGDRLYPRRVRLLPRGRGRPAPAGHGHRGHVRAPRLRRAVHPPGADHRVRGGPDPQRRAEPPGRAGLAGRKSRGPRPPGAPDHAQPTDAGPATAAFSRPIPTRPT